MKSKFLHVLAVGVVTLVILSPGLIIFGIVWEKHVELVKPPNVCCEIIRTNSDHHSLNLSPRKNTAQGFLQKIPIIVAEQFKITTIFQWFVLGTPICIGLGIIAYDRYLDYRAAVLRRQVQMLERLWRQSIEQ
jgi:hypothetical protein